MDGWMDDGWVGIARARASGTRRRSVERGGARE